MIKYVDGVAIEMTDQEIADFEASRAPGPDPVPQTVTPRQARLALLAAGLLDQADAAVAAADRATQIAWEFATEIRRDNPIIAAMAAHLSLTSEQVDALFIAAGGIE